jgi:small subunit ribosomal protein S14
MKKKNLNDFKKRISFRKNELQQISYKLGLRLKSNIKILSIIKLEQMYKTYLIRSFKNRCILTGRSKSILAKFQISRIKFREMFVNGFLIGLKKY